MEARQGRYTEAIPLYRKALALHSAIPGLRLDLGLAYFKAGKLKDALDQFSPLLKSMPQSSPYRQQLVILVGMCHYGLEQYAQAAIYLQEAVNRDPHNLELLLALAHSYLWSKQYRKVMDTYRAILQINANSAEADMLAGEALDAMKNAYGAVQQFRAAVKADPNLPDVHFGLGYLLWTQQQYPQAVPAFQAELHNNPGDAQSLTYLGDCDMQLNHSQLAVPLLQKAIRIDPKIELAYLDLGVIYEAAGHRKEALQDLLAAAKLDPNDVNVHWRLGRLYRSMGDRAQAMAELNKAKTLIQSAHETLVDQMNPNRGSNAPPVATGK